MSTDDRFYKDTDKHFHQVKPCADDRSNAPSNSDVLETTNITPRKGTKAYSIKYSTKNEWYGILIEQQQFKVDQVGIYSLIDDLYKQLDRKEIQDSKDHLWRHKYREQAKVCMLDLYEIGRAEFIIDSSDLDDKARSLLSELDEDTREYVIREVSSRIFASIGVPYFKLAQKCCVIL